MTPIRTSVFLLAITGLTLAFSASAQTNPQPATPAAVPASLLGSWRVDLRPTPSAAPYLKTFEVSAVQGRLFKGIFYDTAFEQGLINSDWGTLRIAFTTADGNTEYHHSATLRDGRLEGLTHAPGRGFLAVWTATRDTAPASPAASPATSPATSPAASPR
jgi:hypothetical protein